MTAVAAGCLNISNEPVLLEITHCEIQRVFVFRTHRSWPIAVLELQKIKWFLLWAVEYPGFFF
jgi:hypothetical protein